MSENRTITKTILQYSEKLPPETMEFLRGIAADYGKVKSYVYNRYSGIGSLDRLTPVYTILNEMRHCGLRTQLDLPVVYYELAIADAVTDIKINWNILKKQLNELITRNEGMSSEEKLYLRTILKLNSLYAAVLNDWPYELPKKTLQLELDVKRLNNWLKRKTRKYMTRPKVKRADYFRISPAGYSYKDNFFRIVCRIPRKRIGIPLKDSRQFDRQILVCLRDDDVVLSVPVDTEVVRHDDYHNTLYAHIGNRDMVTLSTGHIYGKDLNELVDPETEHLSDKNRKRMQLRQLQASYIEQGRYRKANAIEENNLGTFKYNKQKQAVRERTNTYINTELNRLIREEKPQKIVITKAVAVQNRTAFPIKQSNRKVSRSFQGYIRERLRYKCQLHDIELVEIHSKGTGSICCLCGAEGRRLPNGVFRCEMCQQETSIALNSAYNIEKKYNMVNLSKPEDE